MKLGNIERCEEKRAKSARIEEISTKLGFCLNLHVCVQNVRVLGNLDTGEDKCLFLDRRRLRMFIECELSLDE